MLVESLTLPSGTWMSQVHDCPLEYPPGWVEIRPEEPVDVVDHVWVEQTAGDKYILLL